MKKPRRKTGENYGGNLVDLPAKITRLISLKKNSGMNICGFAWKNSYNNNWRDQWKN